MSSSSQITEMSFDDYIESLIIPFEDLELATNNFADENLITQATSSKLYKGRLFQSGRSINIVARRYEELTALVMEAVMYNLLKHKNFSYPFKIVFEENKDYFLINKHEANGSLNMHLSGSTLTWMQRLHICVGVAHALNYLHYVAIKGKSVIHGNIKSSKILLDDKWEPKLIGCKFNMVVKMHDIYFLSKYNGSLQYMDPTYESTGGLTSKSDVFSFGVVLFEVLFGREASIPNPDEDNWQFAQLARSHYDKGTVDDMIDPDLRKQMDLQSLNIFSQTAYYCLKKERSQRPDMDQIVRRLEKALKLQQKHQTLGKNLDHLRIRLTDIELATNKFSETYYIGEGGYGMVYKAKLDHYDGSNPSLIEGLNKDEWPMRNSTVAIKRISSKGLQGFLAEIEILSNCKHQNIVPLLGFCDEGTERILVYDYVSNGSLDDYFGNLDKMTNLTFSRRIQISLDIANGLNYLHTRTEDKPTIIHRDIKSGNILLDDNWVAKIGDFGLSKLHHADQQGSTLNTINLAGTPLYLDPEYEKTGKLKKESDVYSFGVVLFEIMCGRLAYDQIYYVDNGKGLPSIARKRFNEGTLKEMVDPKIREYHDDIFMLNGGINQDSFESFTKIAYQCLAETQSERPTMEVVIEVLEKALYIQENNKNNLHIPLDVIKSATQNFSADKCIGEGRFWKQYEGEIDQHANANGRISVVAKRFDSKSDKGNHQFLIEHKVLFNHNYKHENIIGLVGYCTEMEEKIIVYEYATNGRLDKHLNNANLTWMKRVEICLEVAWGLRFLHLGSEIEEETPMVIGMIHRDIKSASIFLDGDWKPKISNLELCANFWEYEAIDLSHNSDVSLCYIDPEYKTQGYLTAESDIYSIGVILIEMLCGRLAWGEGCEDESQSLVPLAQRHYNKEGNLNELVFEGIKKQIHSESLKIFTNIALRCLNDVANERPGIQDVADRLNEALEVQVDQEIWLPKLPKSLQRTKWSKTSGVEECITAKEIYDLLSKGVLLQDNKVCYSLGSDGEENYLISARKFSYENHWALNWRNIPQSRFQKVADMVTVLNLKIKIKIRTTFLSPGDNYRVHLIFKICCPRKYSNKFMYVNLTYKMGSETFHAFFATWRDEDWMMIELFRVLNHKEEDTNFEILLESFSPIYCGRGPLYVEGIEFQISNNDKREEIEKITEVQQQWSTDCYSILKGFTFLIELIKGKKHLMLSAKEVLYDSSNVKLCLLKHSAESRFHEVAYLLRQQVFNIKCDIDITTLSSDTKYVCYLVFKLSKKCHGLHCPVKVRDLLHPKNKEIEVIYFRSTSEWNLKDTSRVAKKRKDGWMEVIVSKLDSTGTMNLKLITYEGTMSGLIVCGLEFRPM